MRSYNGHSPEKRTRVGTWLADQWNRGILPRPDHCEACLRTDGVFHGHCEDYDRPTDYIPLCNVCHLMLHCRFRNLGRWHQYRNLVRDGLQPPGMAQSEAFQFLRRTYLRGNFQTMHLVNPVRERTVLDDLADVEVGAVVHDTLF